ncbi:bifunctional DNA primase/helicase [Mucilaginibacter sp. KACC 22773]|uniref:bifunctional DNA primase/helicase n=1 Tax=Mucilaginibacter sp. KACC 22773 TaxID=3025671 RepID=UPI002366B1AA|nr:bifunctional DNA primase/helicase [Mucilaginibacter sp. KACC 22773]WDF79555.1 bifunctional DNA primase/helicase [Mucilaginibacter sp. KACC 22773]
MGKKTCPKCSASRKKKNEPCLNVNVIDGTYKCHNCGWKGRVFEKPIYEKKAYIKPVFNNRTELSKKAVDWFATRCVSQQTLIDFKVTEGPEWMPQVFSEIFDKLVKQGKSEDAARAEANQGAKVNTIQFNYFRNGDLINVKYRDAKKNFKLAKNAELIFYNLDAVKDSKECLICEGEPDALSWYEAGYKYVLSVPNGASPNQKLEYFDNCIEYFDNKTKIYISNDDDIPGRALRDELARRLGIERCLKIDLEGLKDANDYLKAHGPEKLFSRISEAKEFEITGVFTVDDLRTDILDIYYNGLPDGDRTGDEQLDEHLRFMPGEMTMVTGVPSHGKSIYLEQLSLMLCINAGWSFAAFSPETYPKTMFLMRLIKKVFGRPAIPKNITEPDLHRILDYLNSVFYIISPDEENFLLDTILEKAKQLVLRKGIKGLIIDPWNRIESGIPNGYNEGKYTIEQLIKITKFAQSCGVHVFLVAHPTKMQKDAGGINYQVPNLYSISGSAHFFNLTQNGLTVFRNDETGYTEIYIQKVKWEHLGKKGMFELRFCPENTRLLPKLTKQSEISAGHGSDDFKCWLPGIGETPNEKKNQNELFFSQRQIEDQSELTATERDKPPF